MEALRRVVEARPWHFVVYGVVAFLLARGAEARLVVAGGPALGLALLALARWVGLAALLLLVAHAAVARALPAVLLALLDVFTLLERVAAGARVEVALGSGGVRLRLDTRPLAPAPAPAPATPAPEPVPTPAAESRAHAE